VNLCSVIHPPSALQGLSYHFLAYSPSRLCTRALSGWTIGPLASGLTPKLAVFCPSCLGITDGEPTSFYFSHAASDFSSVCLSNLLNKCSSLIISTRMSRRFPTLIYMYLQGCLWRIHSDALSDIRSSEHGYDVVVRVVSGGDRHLSGPAKSRGLTVEAFPKYIPNFLRICLLSIGLSPPQAKDRMFYRTALTHGATIWTSCCWGQFSSRCLLSSPQLSEYITSRLPWYVFWGVASALQRWESAKTMPTYRPRRCPAHALRSFVLPLFWRMQRWRRR
jgi:hypothetical protein